MYHDSHGTERGFEVAERLKTRGDMRNKLSSTAKKAGLRNATVSLMAAALFLSLWHRNEQATKAHVVVHLNSAYTGI